MDAITGIAIFGGGVAAGAYLMVSFYSALKGVRDHERKEAAHGMEQARRYNEAMHAELEGKTNALRRMEARRAEEASWCDGYEAGMREAMQNAMNGVTVGDVVTMTRLRNARRARSVNE